MGIKYLYPYLVKKCPTAFHQLKYDHRKFNHINGVLFALLQRFPTVPIDEHVINDLMIKKKKKRIDDIEMVGPIMTYSELCKYSLAKADSINCNRNTTNDDLSINGNPSTYHSNTSTNSTTNTNSTTFTNDVPPPGIHSNAITNIPHKQQPLVQINIDVASIVHRTIRSQYLLKIKINPSMTIRQFNYIIDKYSKYFKINFIFETSAHKLKTETVGDSRDMANRNLDEKRIEFINTFDNQYAHDSISITDLIYENMRILFRYLNAHEYHVLNYNNAMLNSNSKHHDENNDDNHTIVSDNNHDNHTLSDNNNNNNPTQSDNNHDMHFPFHLVIAPENVEAEEVCSKVKSLDIWEHFQQAHRYPERKEELSTPCSKKHIVDDNNDSTCIDEINNDNTCIDEINNDTTCIDNVKTTTNNHILNSSKIVTIVLSEDSDVFPFGADWAIFKFSRSNSHPPVLVDIREILSTLKLSREEFVDVCCLTGCDYTRGLPKVGATTAIKLIQEYKNIETILKNKRLIEKMKYTDETIRSFNFKESRDLFLRELPLS